MYFHSYQLFWCEHWSSTSTHLVLIHGHVPKLHLNISCMSISDTSKTLWMYIYIYISKLIKYILASGFRCSFGPNWSLDPAIVGKVWHHAVNWRLVLSHVPPGTDDKNAPQISSSFCKAIIKKDIYEDMETYPNVHIYIYIYLVGFMKNNYPKIYDLVGFIPGYMLQLGWCCLNSSQC